MGRPATRLDRSVVVKTIPLPLLLMALLLGAEGCFSYVAESELTPTRGTPIRVHLERPASFELTRLTVNNVIIVSGELVDRNGGDVVLSATWLETDLGGGFDGEGWTLRIPDTNVSALEVKKFSWWRTGVAVLGTAAATIFGFDALGGGSGGEGGGGGGGQQF